MQPLRRRGPALTAGQHSNGARGSVIVEHGPDADADGDVDGGLLDGLLG